MNFGKWELRNDGSAYYFSSDAQLYPSSNSTDQGKLHTEENVRNIYRDIVGRNFVTKYNYFTLTLNPGRNGVFVSPGECVIQGYHFYTKNTIEVKVPSITNSNSAITQYTLGISLSYDAANHVTGDIVNKEGNIGESEVLSGVYLYWFDECQLECDYDNILVLGRAWVQNGAIVQDGTEVDGRVIYHGFEQDPFKDHKFEAKDIELNIHGHKTTKYDTLRDNMTQIHDPLYTYDSMHFPLELDRQHRTKMPTHTTDLQDFVDHIPDWFTSKYGDYMTGALRFNNLSIDAMREFRSKEVIKDSVNNLYSDSAYISPRTYGNMVRDNDATAEFEDYDYNVGGTLMTIVPRSYTGSTDNNDGYTGIHAALVSQLYGETGLRLHYGLGTGEQERHNTTRIVHYNDNDTGQKYVKDPENPVQNTSKFIIENIDNNGVKASINIKNGEMFFDSYNYFTSDSKNSETLNGITGKYSGVGFQFYASGRDTNVINNIDFRIDEYKISMAEHNKDYHRLGNRGTQHLGLVDDDLHFEVGLGISYDIDYRYSSTYDVGNYRVIKQDNTDPYLELGNLRLRSNEISDSDVKLNTIEVINKSRKSNDDSTMLPYVRIKPRVYSEQYLAEELIQVGTAQPDDYMDNHAQNDTLNRIVMKKVNINSDVPSSFTYFEQDFRLSNGNNEGTSKVFNKMIPAINNIDIIGKDGVYSSPNYEEIAGIYSAGNIGCSAGNWLNTGRSNETMGANNNPYNDDAEYVRFTRFRYGNEKDSVNGGPYTGGHEDNRGREWGATYNIEFNTQVANQRANQIIWKYKGSKGTQSETQTDHGLKNTPPVVLSYIHDNTEEDQGTPTRYTNYSDSSNPGYNGGKGTYETWIDHAGVTQHNPTYKIRDFLLLENAGLVVNGDINNPSLVGDTLNPNNHLGVTILAGRVYNAVYNDFAETFEKLNVDEVAKPGDLIALDPDSGKYTICEGYENKLVVGVQSNTYAYLAGGNRVNKTQDIINLENEYFTVAVSGKVWVNVVKDSYIEPGDMLVSSFEKGKATKSTYDTRGTIIGKALTKPKYFEEHDEYKVLVLVMTA